MESYNVGRSVTIGKYDQIYSYFNLKKLPFELTFT